MDKGTAYDELIRQEQELFGLDGWVIESKYAEGERKELMERERWPCCMEMGAGDLITFYFHEERMEDPNISKEAVIDHELGHVIINPYPCDGFQMGRPLEEIQATHINRACQMLREAPEEVEVPANADLQTIIDKAMRLTRLTENDWRIHVEEKDKIEWGDERLPAFAYSNYYLDNMHLAALSAREIILKIDPRYIEENGASLPEVVLRELWRIVLNPYGKPDVTNTQERQLGHIMKAMKGLGWGRNRNGE